ncbi:MAG: DeoR/GlpR family DNA-binding transcription regulator [Omnitrophica WOR_2 bacterium]
MLVKEERHRRIIEWVNNEISINIKDLQNRLQVSMMTVWRDLDYLEKKGVIQRVRGGIMKKGGNTENEPFFESKRGMYNEQKRAIAEYAAAHFVQDNEIIILEGGTTVAGMVPLLDRPGLTIMTNGLDALVQAARLLPDINVICCGGMLRSLSLTFVGPQAESFFSGFHAHKFFLCASGLDLSSGITDPNPLEIQVKRAMHHSAEKTILLLDSSKFNVRSLSQIVPLDEIDILVTDCQAPKDILDALSAQGVEVHIVDEPTGTSEREQPPEADPETKDETAPGTGVEDSA